MIDLGPQSRVVFAVLWIGAQVVLVATARRRVDGAFGFRVFTEPSTLELHLERETDAGLLPAPSGEWTARDARGELHRFAFSDRVRDPVLRVDTPVRGPIDKLVWLEPALDDVMDHLDQDAETRALVMTVRVNGRETRVRSKRRP